MAVAELVASKTGTRIDVDVPHRETLLIKQVPGAAFHPKTERWRVRLSWAACKQLRGVFGDKLHIGPALADWAWQRHAEVSYAQRMREFALDPQVGAHDGDERLYPFQQTGVAFLDAAGSAILGDDLGTGKTVQSLVAVQHWPLLVVTTKSVKGQWAAAIREWAGGSAVVLDGSVAQRRKQLAQFTEDGGVGWRGLALVVNWDQLAAHSRLAPYGSIALSDKDRTPKELNEIAWGTVIADEAHKAKEPKAKQTRALWAVGDVARARYALTGSPTEGSLLDFWALLRFVAPDEWPTKTGFVDRYCVQEFNPYGGLEANRLRADTEDEFRALMELRFLRRPKALVAPWLPPLVPVIREVQMSTAAARAYKALEKEFVAELDGGGEIVAFTDLSRAGRLAQLTDAMLEETGEGDYQMVEPSPKLDEFHALLDELGKEPVVAFSSSRQLLYLAQRRLEKAEIPYGIIAGDLPQAARDIARDDYNEGRVRVLLVSAGAGAEGLNLTRGRYQVFLNRDWSFLRNSQAEGRLHGIGRGDQDADAITVIDLIVPGTIDEGRHKLYREKGELMEHLVKDKEAVKRMIKGEV